MFEGDHRIKMLANSRARTKDKEIKGLQARLDAAEKLIEGFYVFMDDTAKLRNHLWDVAHQGHKINRGHFYQWDNGSYQLQKKELEAHKESR